MLSALGHDVPGVFVLVFAVGSALAARGVIGGFMLLTSRRSRMRSGRSCSSSSSSAAQVARRGADRVDADRYPADVRGGG
jgi:hypothetical protein